MKKTLCFKEWKTFLILAVTLLLLVSCDRTSVFSGTHKSNASTLEMEKQFVTTHVPSLLSLQGKETANLSETILCSIDNLEKHKSYAEKSGTDSELEAKGYALRFYFYNSQNEQVASYVGVGENGVPSHAYKFHTKRKPQPKGGSDFQRNVGILDEEGNSVRCTIQVSKRLSDGRTVELGFTRPSGSIKIVPDVPPKAKFSQKPNEFSNALTPKIVLSESVTYKYAIVKGNETCKDASYSSEQTGSVITADVSNNSKFPDGNLGLCVITMSPSGNWQDPKDATETRWTKDTQSPVADELTLTGVPVGTNNVTALSVAASGIDAYRFKVSSEDTCSIEAGYSDVMLSIEKITSSLEALADGTVFLCVRGEDLAGNQIALTEVKKASWNKDTIAPEISLSNLPPSTSNVISLSVGVSGVGVEKYKYALTTQLTPCVSSNYISNWVDVSVSIDAPLGGDGGKRLCVIAQDAAGNITSLSEAKQYDWLKDTDTPTPAEIGVSPLPSSPSNLTSINVSVSGNTFSYYKYALTTQATSCAAASYAAEWSLLSTPISEALGADGNHRLCVVARDAAGNETLPSNAKLHDWTKDTLAPTASDVTLSNLPASISNVDALNISVGGVASYKYALTTQSQPCSSATYSSNWIPTSSTISNQLTADGQLRLCVLGRDTAGNGTLPAGAKEFDWTLNTSDAVAQINNAPSGRSNATSLSVTVEGADVVSYKYALITSGTCADASYGTFRSVSTSITDALGVADGQKTLCVLGKNVADTEQLASSASSATWTKDTQAPGAADILLAGVPAATSGTTSLNIQVSGTDLSFYRYKIAVTDTCANDADYSALDIAISTPITSDISGLSDGSVFLCVRAKDSATNETSSADAKKVSWTKDTTAPTASDISLANVPTGESKATTIDVTVSGVAAYRFKLDATNTCSTESGYSSSDILVATHITADISSDVTYPQGNLFLCVRGVDSQGNMTLLGDAKVASWVKDTVAPVASLDEVTVPQSESNDTNITVSVEGTSVTHYLYALLGPNASETCADATYTNLGSAIAVSTPISESLGADGSYLLCVKGLDAAGNVQTSATSYAWVKDVAVPTASDIILSNLPVSPFSQAALDVTVGGVVAYRYALTTQATLCANASYSDDVLINVKVTDALGNGLLRLCVRGKDAAGNLTAAADAKMHDWTQDDNEPLASHIALAGLPAARSNVSPLSITVSADASWAHSNFTHFNFALVNDDATLCDDANLTYNGWNASNAIAPVLSAEGNKRLCVLVRTASGKESSKANAKMFDWVFDTSAPVANDLALTDTPAALSNEINLNVLVSANGGADITKYKYALTDQTTACDSLNEGLFSAWLDEGTRITSAAGSDGEKRLCIVGQDTAGNSSNTNAKVVDWTQDSSDPTVTLVADTSPTELSSQSDIASVTFRTSEAGSYTLLDVTDSQNPVTVTNGSVLANVDEVLNFTYEDLASGAGTHLLLLRVVDLANNDVVTALNSVEVVSEINNLVLNFYHDGTNQSQHKLQWEGETTSDQKIKIVRVTGTTVPPSTVAGGTLVATIVGDKRLHTFNGVANNEVAFSLFLCDSDGNNCVEPPNPRATVSYKKNTVVQNDSEGHTLRVRFSGNPGGSTVRMGYSKNKKDILAWDGLSNSITDGAASICATSPCTETFSNNVSFPPWTKLYFRISVTTSGGVTTFSELGYWAKVPPGMVFVSKEDWPVEFTGHTYHSQYYDGVNGPFDFAIDKYEAHLATGTLSGNSYPNSDSGVLKSASGQVPAFSTTWASFKQGCENRTLDADYADFVGNIRLANLGAPAENAKVRVHLATDAEWMVASYKTPDSTTCNVSSGARSNTGAFNASCISRYGAMDMIGNLSEWTDGYYANNPSHGNGLRTTFSQTQTTYHTPLSAVPHNTTFSYFNFSALHAASFGTSGNFFSDTSYFASGGPYVSSRGGKYNDSTAAGRFQVNANTSATSSAATIGGRCALAAPTAENLADVPRCDGQPYGTTEERTRYTSSNPLGSCSSVSETQTRTCQTDGTWSAWTGTANLATCNSGCGAIRHTESKTYYQYANSATCSESQNRTCTDGVLSGSSTYSQESCSTQICSPNAFVTCNNPQSVYCNATGTGYNYYYVDGQCGYSNLTPCDSEYWLNCNGTSTMHVCFQGYYRPNLPNSSSCGGSGDICINGGLACHNGNSVICNANQNSWSIYEYGGCSHNPGAQVWNGP